MDYVMKYVVMVMDYDDCYFDLIALFDDIQDAQELCLALYQEQDYEDYFTNIHYYDIPEECLNTHMSPSECNYFVKEVPYFGS